MDAEAVRDKAQALYGGDIYVQQEAADFYVEFLNAPDAPLLAMDVMSNFSDLYSNYAAIYVLQNIIENSWEKIDDPLKIRLKDLMLSVLDDPDRAESIRSSAARVLAWLGMREYPEHWDSFIRDSLLSSSARVMCEFLELLSRNRSVTRVRGNRVKAALIREIGAFVEFFLYHPETGLKLFQWLLEWAPLNILLKQESLSLLLRCLQRDDLRATAIECLDTVFVQRRDSIEIMSGAFGKHIIAGICGVAQNDQESAALLSRILVKNLHVVNLEPEGVTRPKDIERDKSFNLKLISQALEILLNEKWADSIDQYFAFWGKILKYFDSPNRKMDVAVIDTLRYKLIRKMFDVVVHASDDEIVINSWARDCVRVLCKVYNDRMCTFLSEEELSLNALMITTAGIDELPKDLVLDIINGFIKEGTVPVEWRTTIIPCVCVCVCTYPEESDLTAFFIDSLFEFIRSRNQDLVHSAIVALNYTSMKQPDLFFMNGNAILEELSTLVTDLGPQVRADSDIMAIYKLLASMVLRMPDKTARVPFVRKCLQNVVGPLLSTDPSLVMTSEEVLNAVDNALDVLVEFGLLSCQMSDAYGDELFPMVILYLNTLPSDHSLINKLYELAGVLIRGPDELDLFGINVPAEPGLCAQLIAVSSCDIEARAGYLLNCLAKVEAFSDVMSPHVVEIYTPFILPLLSDPNADTEFALKYMNEAHAWEMGIPFPLNLIGDQFSILSNGAVSELLKLLQNYLKMRSDEARTFVDREGAPLTNFIIGIICDFNYTQHIYVETYILDELILSCKTYGMSGVDFCRVVYNLLSQTYLCEYPEVSKGFSEYLLSFYEKVTSSDTMFTELLQNIRKLVRSTCCGMPICEYLFDQDQKRTLDDFDRKIDEGFLALFSVL